MLFILCLLLFPISFSFFLFYGHVLKLPTMLSHISYTDSCMGHGVIRWRQYQDQPSKALLISCSCLPTCVINMTPLLWKCLRHAGSWLPSLTVTSASAQARKSLLLSGVAKGYTVHFTAYMPYWNAKCCLIFVLFWKSSTSFEAGFEEDKPSVHWLLAFFVLLLLMLCYNIV